MGTRGRSQVRSRGAKAGTTSEANFDSDASAYFNRSGITDLAVKTAINNFISGVKLDFSIASLSERFDQLTMQANESEIGAPVDMTGNHLDQTLINSPIFTQWRGVKNANSTQYINSNFNPALGTPKWTLNAHTWGGYVRSPTSGAQNNTMGSINAGFNGYQIWGNDGSGNFVGSDGSTSNSLYFANPGGPQVGLFSINRTASNSVKWYRNNDVLASASWAPNLGILNQNFYFIGRNHDGLLGFATIGTEVALTYIGQLSDTELTAFYARVQTLATTIGWNV